MTTERKWRRVRMWTLSQRMTDDVPRAKRWRWVRWRRPGQPEHLALLTPLHGRLGLLEVRGGKGGPWLRPLKAEGLR